MKVLTDGQFSDLHLHFFDQLSIYLILLHRSTQVSSCMVFAIALFE